MTLNADLDKVVAKTDGYSGSDMRNLIQEACQGPVRSAVAAHGEGVANLCDADLRAVSSSRFARTSHRDHPHEANNLCKHA